MFGSVHDRFELLSIELHEEKQRLIQTFVWITVFILAAALALAFASVALLVAVWNTQARVPVVLAIAFLHTALALVAGLKLKRSLKDHGPPFAASLEELRTDRACLQPEE